ncbi:hypothetical protein Tco_1051735, partial [Tanacetum coccineum]
MEILDELLMEEMRYTDAYRDYIADFTRIEVPTMQPQPLVSTQGIISKPSAPRSPNLEKASKKKGKQIVGESSEPKKSLKIWIKQRQPDMSIHVPTVTDIERDQLMKVTQLSLAEAETAKEYEVKQNVALVDISILAEDVEKLVEGDEVSNEVFADSIIMSQEVPG